MVAQQASPSETLWSTQGSNCLCPLFLFPTLQRNKLVITMAGHHAYLHLSNHSRSYNHIKKMPHINSIIYPWSLHNKRNPVLDSSKGKSIFYRPASSTVFSNNRNALFSYANTAVMVVLKWPHQHAIYSYILNLPHFYIQCCYLLHGVRYLCKKYRLEIKIYVPNVINILFFHSHEMRRTK